MTGMDKKDFTSATNYQTKLVMERDSDGISKYERWLREHQKKLRRLEREAAGELVPEQWGDEDESF